MAKSKTTTARPRAKHAKPRATAKPPARKKAVAKQAKPATPSKAAKRTPVKRTSVKPRRSAIREAIEPQHVEPAVEAVATPEVDVDEVEVATPEVEPIVGEGSGAAKKPGALARLKSGVGNLLARMTGRATPKDSLDNDGVPRDDRTLEIVTGDIILQRDADAPQSAKGGRKPPPPPVPGAETSDD